MAVLLDLERCRPALLDRVPEPVERSDARVAAPREDQPAGAAHADHLVVDEVRGQPYQGEIAPTLPDDLVARGEGNEVGEPLQGNAVAVGDEIGHRLGQAREARHYPQTSSAVSTTRRSLATCWS